MEIEQVYSELVLRISSLTDLYQQVESHVSDTFSWFWTVMFGVFAVIGTALFFIARELTKSGVDKEASKLEDKFSKLQNQVEEITGPDTVLLWENAAPTSPFPAQMLQLDFRKYTCIGVEYLVQPTNDAAHYRVNLSCVGRITCLTDFCYTESGAKPAVYQRYYSVTTAGLDFQHGLLRDCSGTSATYERDNILTPQRIYGIK